MKLTFQNPFGYPAKEGLVTPNLGLRSVTKNTENQPLSDLGIVTIPRDPSIQVIPTLGPKVCKC